MKSENIFYPYDVVLKVMPVILKQGGCRVISIDGNNGVIEACHKEGFFKGNIDVNVMLDRRQDNITGIVFWANVNDNIFTEKSHGDDLFEEKLLQTIHKYF